MFGWQAQSTMNEARFNNNSINVLSIKSASNVKLKIACDLVIFTSPLCDDIFEFKKRFSNVLFAGDYTLLYKIYCNNTTENKLIETQVKNNNIKIINETEECIYLDENSGDIVL